MTTPTHDPEIEQEAARMLKHFAAEYNDCGGTCGLILRSDLLLLLRELATLRRGAAKPFDAKLAAAIRIHMNMRGDDRCSADDHELYMVLPEGDTRPERETLVTIENCQRYIACRQQGREYISPQRRIEELETELAALRSRGGEGSELLDEKCFNEGLREHIADLMDAMKPFVALVHETSGRIPTEKLSIADWHALSKSFKSTQTALAPDSTTGKAVSK